MSAASIQKKLHKAYGKVAKKLGFQSDIYRVSQSYLNPINTNNWIYNAKVSFSQDVKFGAPVGSNVFLAWIDATLDTNFNLRVGDIVSDQETGRVYYIIDMYPLHPIRALETNTTITIARSGEYATSQTGQWGVSEYNAVASNLPAWVSVSGSQAIDGGFVPARTPIVQSNDVYNVQLWMPEGSIKPNDVIVLKDETELVVTTAAWDIRGYKLTASVIK